MIPILWNHDHRPEGVMGSIQLESHRLMVTFNAAIPRATFEAMFPGAGYELVEFEALPDRIWVKRAAIIEYSYLPIFTMRNERG